MFVLGIDVGTGSVKVAVVDTGNRCIVGQVAKHEVQVLRPIGDAAEINPKHLLAAIRSAVQHAAKEFGRPIQGVGVSCLTPALCLLDSACQPIGNIRIHLDRRARGEAMRVEREVGDEFASTTGNRPLPGGISALSWMQLINERPDSRREVRHYLNLNSWLVRELTGQFAIDPANASFSGLWNTATDQKWSARWCEYFQVNPEWLPVVVDGTSRVGTVTENVAREFGIPAGIPVAIGTADTSCGMIAAQLQPGELYHSVGTTQVLAAIVDRPVPDRRRLCRHFGIGQRFVHVTHNPVGGVALNWLHRLCFSEIPEAEFFQDVVPKAINRSVHVSLTPPFLGGDRLQIAEVEAAFTGLTLATERIDLLAAILQAMARGHQQAVRDLGVDTDFTRVILAGGGAALVRSIVPEYAECNVQIVRDGAVRGAAMLLDP